MERSVAQMGRGSNRLKPKSETGLKNIKTSSPNDKEFEHRRNIELRQTKAQIERQKFIHRLAFIAQAYAFIICICFLASGTYLISTDHEVAGTVLGGSSLYGIVTAFLTKRQYTL